MTTKKLDAHSQNLQRVYDSGGWFMTNRELFHAFSLEEACLLSHLINIGSIKKTVWFCCRIEQLKEVLNLSDRQQRRLMSHLVRRGVLKVKMMGGPAKRFVSIDYVRMHKLISDAAEKRFPG